MLYALRLKCRSWIRTLVLKCDYFSLYSWPFLYSYIVRLPWNDPPFQSVAVSRGGSDARLSPAGCLCYQIITLVCLQEALSKRVTLRRFCGGSYFLVSNCCYYYDLLLLMICWGHGKNRRAGQCRTCSYESSPFSRAHFVYIEKGGLQGSGIRVRTRSNVPIVLPGFSSTSCHCFILS